MRDLSEIALQFCTEVMGWKGCYLAAGKRAVIWHPNKKYIWFYCGQFSKRRMQAAIKAQRKLKETTCT